MSGYDNRKNYENFAAAICMKAAEDYISARKYLWKGHKEKELEWLEKKIPETDAIYADFGFAHPTSMLGRLHQRYYYLRRKVWGCKKMLWETEEFIRSPMFEWYSGGLDGNDVFERLKRRCDRRNFRKVSWNS